MLFDKLKRLLSRHPSEEARLVIQKSTTTRELLHGLDALHTRNEMEFNDVTREVEKLEELEDSETVRVRGGDLSDRRKRNALLKIRRLRKQMENLDNRLKIYDHNMSLHLNLIGKVQEVEAMELRGIEENDIDKILIDFEEKLESYMGSLASAQVVEESSPIPEIASEGELSALEREVLHSTPEPAQSDSDEVEETVEALERKVLRKSAPAAEAEAEAEPTEDEPVLEGE